MTLNISLVLGFICIAIAVLLIVLLVIKVTARSFKKEMAADAARNKHAIDNDNGSSSTENNAYTTSEKDSKEIFEMDENFEITPESVINVRFGVTRFAEGYEMSEVDYFLDEIILELRRLEKENQVLKNAITLGSTNEPIRTSAIVSTADLLNKRFGPTKFREGYNQYNVDEFLDVVIHSFRARQKQNDALRLQILGSLDD